MCIRDRLNPSTFLGGPTARHLHRLGRLSDVWLHYVSESCYWLDLASTKDRLIDFEGSQRFSFKGWERLRKEQLSRVAEARGGRDL